MSGLGFDPADAPVLQRGSQDQDWVAYLQQVLGSLGYPCGAADGDFGGLTESTVVEFQRSRGLSDSGIVDYETWTALGSALDGNDGGDAGYGLDTGWHDAGYEQSPAEQPGSGDDMSYLLPEERDLDVLAIETFIERSGDQVVASAVVTNNGYVAVDDAELTLTLNSGYGRQDTATMRAGLPPSQSIAVDARLDIAEGDTSYNVVAFAVGAGVLPATGGGEITVDAYD